jgi:proline dehydrogenase
MLHALSKAFFHALAGSRALERLASRYGMARPTSFARRFVAGETLAEALDAARDVQARGMAVTLDLLGERVTTLSAAGAAAQAIIGMIQPVVQSDIDRNISIKLSQLGLGLDPAVCTDHVRKILEAGRPHGFFIRMDMEASHTVAATLAVFATLWDHGCRDLGVALQSALYRSEEDARRLSDQGVRVRLIKGAYKEPKGVAHQTRAEVDAAYVRIMEGLLVKGTYPALATHDPAMIEAAKRMAAARGIGRDRFEFQMLYGIRRDLQSALVKDGYRLRVYIPFGSQWFPYFCRRLGERPANVGFVVRAILQDR